MHFVSFSELIHTVIKKTAFFPRNTVLFYDRDKIPIAVHVFAIFMLTLLSVDEILQPRYMNWSSDVIGLHLL